MHTLRTGVDKRRTDRGRRTADGGAFYKHTITTATNYNIP